ncbi:hypothetical protein V8C34DRAFT_271693 [Trichoderma compactum]
MNPPRLFYYLLFFLHARWTKAAGRLRFGLLPFDATWPREKLPVIATQIRTTWTWHGARPDVIIGPPNGCHLL